MTDTLLNSESNAKSASGSDIVGSLERAYDVVRSKHPELPAVVINIGTGVRGRQSRWGHFHHDRWVDAVSKGRHPELFIAGERLACGAEAVLETLLHESAHALGAVRDIKNTSGPSNKYHNRKFLTLAEELTLKHKGDGADPQHGFAFTDITDKTREVYAEALAILKDSTSLYLDNLGNGTPKKKKAKDRNLIKCVCECAEPLVVRMSQKVLDTHAVFCSECSCEFYEAY